MKTYEDRTISKETFKKLFLLYTTSLFHDGVYGKKRLHKIVYIIERDFYLKPFEFKKYFYGQYSDTMDDIQDQLLSMGYMTAYPLETTSPEHSGNKFELADKDLGQYYSTFMEKINSSLTKKIIDTINEFGYLKEEELVEKAYSFPEFIHAKPEEVIFKEELPERMQVKDLSEEDIEELEISFNPRFVNLLNRLDNVFEQEEFDPQKVKKVVELI
jgi:hypothetical protein